MIKTKKICLHKIKIFKKINKFKNLKKIIILKTKFNKKSQFPRKISNKISLLSDPQKPRNIVSIVLSKKENMVFHNPKKVQKRRKNIFVPDVPSI